MCCWWGGLGGFTLSKQQRFCLHIGAQMYIHSTPDKRRLDSHVPFFFGCKTLTTCQ